MRGFTLLELLVTGFLAFIVWLGIMLAGWGISFAFTYNVFVPWIGIIPAEYHNLAAFLTAFLFDGIASILIIAVLGGLTLLVGGAIGLTRKK